MSIKQKVNGVVSDYIIHASDIQLLDVNNNFTSTTVEGALKENVDKIGVLNELPTKDKTSVVNSIKEINTSLLDMTINIKSFGFLAIGDGTSHKIKDTFPNVTLAQVQALNTNATLDDEADWYALALAINYCKNSNYKYSKIYIPTGKYLISKPIIIDFPLNVEGVYCIDEKYGTVLYDTSDANSTIDFIKFQYGTNTSAYTNRIYGLTIKNILIKGNNQNHRCLALIKTGWDMHIENVNIQNFHSNGLYSDSCFDSTINGLTILDCGGYYNNTAYFAMDLDSSSTEGGGCTNAWHIFGLHIESSISDKRYALRLGNTRHNNFTNCKFEIHGINTDLVNPVILLDTKSMEASFSQCLFVGENIDNWKTANSSAGYDGIPYYIKCVSGSNQAKAIQIVNSHFAEANSKGVKWLDSVDSTKVIFTGNQVLSASASANSFKLTNSIMKDNIIYFYIGTDGIMKGIYSNTSTITDNKIYIMSNSTAIDTSQMNYVIYAWNSIIKYNEYANEFNTIIVEDNGSNAFNDVHFKTKALYIDETYIKNKYNISTIDYTNIILDMSKFSSSLLLLNLSADCIITNITNAFMGQKIIIFNNTNHLVTINSGGNTSGQQTWVNGGRKILKTGDFIEFINLASALRSTNVSAMQSKTIIYDTTYPTSGTWNQGDIVYNSSPSVGSPKGWICTVSGSPGTWVSLGNL